MEATSKPVLQPETLTGDVRDVLLTHVRSMETPWSKLSQREQEAKIYAIEKTAETMVRGAVRVVANQGFSNVLIRLGKWSVNGELKLEVTGAGSVENITKLAEHGTGEAVLVLTEVGEYFGQRDAARAEPDQPSLAIDDEEEGDGDGDPDAPLGEGEREFASGPAPDAGTKPARRNRRVIRETEAA